MRIPHPAFPSINTNIFSRRGLNDARAENWGNVIIGHLLQHPSFGVKVQSKLVFIDLLFFKDSPKSHSYLGFVGFLYDRMSRLSSRYLEFLNTLLVAGRGVGRHPEFQAGFGDERQALKLSTRIKLPPSRMTNSISNMDVAVVVPHTLDRSSLPDPSKFSAEENFSNFIDGLPNVISCEDGRDTDICVLAVPLFALNSSEASYGGAIFIAFEQDLAEEVVLSLLGYLVHSIAISDGLRIALEVFFDVYENEGLPTASPRDWNTIVRLAQKAALGDDRLNLPRHHMRGGSEEVPSDSDLIDNAIRTQLDAAALTLNLRGGFYEGEWSSDRSGIPFRALIGGSREDSILKAFLENPSRTVAIPSSLVDRDLSAFLLTKAKQIDDLCIVISRPLVLEYCWFNAPAVVSALGCLLLAHQSHIKDDGMKCPLIVDVSDGVSTDHLRCWIHFRVRQTRIIGSGFSLRIEMPTLHGAQYRGSGKSLRQFDLYMRNAGAKLLSDDQNKEYSSCYEIVGEKIGYGYCVHVEEEI